ncbi:MAG TPA: YeeE/YedE thiosulfate transporter family protein [Planctomycetota bacterium]|nr:YeeE/YedE thiosulfate transporter family protein [Planctomycetota bacterium]
MDGDAALRALEGGALIGLAAGALLALTGKTAGVSGIVEGVVRGERGEWGWKAAFVLGLLAGGFVLRVAVPGALATSAPRALPLIAVGGVLVGFGARLGGGCTSGHGVCGIGRLSLRGVAGTLVFIATGMATVYLARRLG